MTCCRVHSKLLASSVPPPSAFLGGQLRPSVSVEQGPPNQDPSGTVRRQVVVARVVGSVPGSYAGVRYLQPLHMLCGSGLKDFIKTATGTYDRLRGMILRK